MLYDYCQYKTKITMSNNLVYSNHNNSNVIISTQSNASVLVNNILSLPCNKKNDVGVEYKYICIKKDFFDVNMIYLNYTNMKKRKYIEIIYKSPSIFLEGLFFKTPYINSSQVSIIHKDRHNYNNITLRIILDMNENSEFIKMLKNIDEYINNYILRCAKDINNELFNNEPDTYSQQQLYQYNNTIQPTTGNMAQYQANALQNWNSSMNTIEMFRYEPIIKKRFDVWELNMKSYLDKQAIDVLYKKLPNMKYIFTFNISNIYLGNVSLIPLIKCNKCEIQN
jgi:hypothetical protein